MHWQNSELILYGCFKSTWLVVNHVRRKYDQEISSNSHTRNSYILYICLPGDNFALNFTLNFSISNPPPHMTWSLQTGTRCKMFWSKYPIMQQNCFWNVSYFHNFLPEMPEFGHVCLLQVWWLMKEELKLKSLMWNYHSENKYTKCQSDQVGKSFIYWHQLAIWHCGAWLIQEQYIKWQPPCDTRWCHIFLMF